MPVFAAGLLWVVVVIVILLVLVLAVFGRRF